MLTLWTTTSVLDKYEVIGHPYIHHISISDDVFPFESVGHSAILYGGRLLNYRSK